METKPIIAVTGATGKQGGAVAEHLLKAGFRVRAITRNAQSAAAEKLKQKGADVVAADMENKASLLKALEGARGVFSMQNYWEKGIGYEGEIRQGKNLADAATEAGVQHFVQASIADAEKAKGVGHWECKAVIENYIKEKGLTYTFLGETFFMDNFLDPKLGSKMLSFLAGFLKPETRFQIVAVDDIGAVAAKVFAQPEKYINTKINIAGEAPTLAEMRETYNSVMPKKAMGIAVPKWLGRLINAEMAKQLEWNDNPGWTFSLDEVREVLPQPTDFKTFLKNRQN